MSGLARTRLATSVHDAGWAQLLRLIGEKAEHYGRTFHQVGRFTPTSQTCSACGANDGPKPLQVRSWQCKACGAMHDRDVNAARNILAAGRAERLNACGGTVRPVVCWLVPVKQELTEVPRERHGRNPRRPRQGGRQTDQRVRANLTGGWRGRWYWVSRSTAR